MTDCLPTIKDAFELLLKIEQGNKGPAAGAKRKAYRGALEKLAEMSAVTSEEDLKSLRGKAKDGGSIYQRALEILATGTCAVLEEAKDDKDVWAAYDIFLEIHGIGPTAAYDLASMGLRTIEDLEEAVDNGSVTLNNTQLIGLKYHDNITLRIPRPEMLEHEKVLKEVAAAAGCPRSDIVGSFRRDRPDSGDIDLLICSNDHKMLDAIVERLRAAYYIRTTIAHGAHKYMGICRYGKLPFRRLDILLTPPEEYGYALLYFTGSQKFNILVRQHALTLGYTLNEHRLTPTSAKAKPIPVLRTEEEILAFLGIKFVEPKDRESIEALTLVV